MDEWGKFTETSLPERKEFYRNLIMEYNTDTDFLHAKRICKDFEIIKLCEYHDLFLKSDTLLLGDGLKTLEKYV